MGISEKTASALMPVLAGFTRKYQTSNLGVGGSNPSERAKLHPRMIGRSSRPFEIFLHWLEIAALPSSVPVAGVAVGHVGVAHRNLRASRRGLKQHLDLRIRIGRRELGGAPRLNEAARRFELEVASGDVTVPYRKFRPLARRDLRRFPARHLFVAAAAEPSVVDLLRGCRNDIGHGELEWHLDAP